MEIQSTSTTSVAPRGLDADHAQRVLDYVADRLAEVDDATSERLLDEFVDRLRRLDDIAAVKRSIVEADAIALKDLGGVEAAKNLIGLIERIGPE